MFCTRPSAPAVVACLALLAFGACAAPAEDEGTSANGDGADVTLDTAIVDDLGATSDSGPEDVGSDAPADLASDCPGGPFCPCSEHNECDSSMCIHTPAGSVCAKTCVENCPSGYVCSLVNAPGGDTVNVCVARWGRLCDPCAVDKDCEALGIKDTACVDMGKEGSYCSQPCGKGECPSGFICKTTFSTAGGKGERCIPEPGLGQTFGTCTCSESATAKKLQTDCWIEPKDDKGKVFGKCKGVRRCDTDGLTKCLAPPASAEICDGEDNDCDGQTDEATCDDKNPCTQDLCDPKRSVEGGDGCIHNNTEAPCDADGNVCTANDRCEDGVCTPGKAKQCDDGNACTKDVCLPASGCTQTDDDGAPCDDDNPCTLSDLCKAGGCEPGIPKKCKSGDPCVLAACNILTGKCKFKPMPDGVPCDDGTACTKSDACLTGTCLGKVVDCDDGNTCTNDGCDAKSGCTYKPNSQPCTDANKCTEADVCQGGKCVGKALDVAADCSDNNTCTKDSCDPKKGCQHTSEKGDCSDGNPCTKDDNCVDGTCKGGENTCQCENNGDCKPFEDGDACNGTLICDKAAVPFKCAVDKKTVVTCSGAKDTACLANVCDKSKGACKLLPKSDGKSCDADGDICTVGDKCAQGNCVPGPQKGCDDGNPCTDDSCDKKAGCAHVANKSPCQDGNACTVGDACSQKVCIAGKKTICNDSEACTSDSCDKKSGKCLFTGIPGCGGYCQSAADCDDNKVCTSDICIQGKCLISNNSKACDDQDKCTVSDACKDGKCGGDKRDCNDGNECTTDSCKAGIGCINQPHDLACEDGNKCTSGDQCKTGACKPGGIKNCDDSDKCTTDACDPKTGKCANKPIMGCGGHCADASHCNDNNVCTDDKCNLGGAKTGKCAHTKNAAKCDDGDSCTTGDVCKSGACVGGEGVEVSTFAGAGTKGLKDDNPKIAEFNTPSGMAAFGGNLFVADRGNHAIRKIAADGLVNTHAGTGKSGYKDGYGKLAAFHSPYDLDADKAGNLYVADTGNHRVRRVTQQGAVVTLAGSGKAGFVDGGSSTARFYSPRGVAVTPLGAVFVADWQNNRIRTVAPDGDVGTLAGSGIAASTDGKGKLAGVQRPTAITLATNGDLYFTEGSPSSRIRRVTQQGVVTTITGAGDGVFDGASKQARFNNPYGIAIDSAGGILVADLGNHRIRKVSAVGFVSTLVGYAGFGFKDGDPGTAKLDSPMGLTVDAYGKLYIGDSGNHRVRLLIDSTGNCSVGGKCYGSGLRKPGSPCLVCDPSKNKSGWTPLLAGTPCQDGSFCTVDEKCTAQAACSGKTKDCDDFDKCTTDSCEGATGTCIHKAVVGQCGHCTAHSHCDDGNACTSDSCVKNVCQHKFNSDPCKSGNPCSVGEKCSQGKCVAEAAVGVTTIAGGKKGSGDGSTNQSSFNRPIRVAVGPGGTLYVADYYNSRIRRVSGDHKTVVTIAGSTSGYLDAKGVQARFNQPAGLDVGVDGTVYVADRANHRIRKIDKAANVTTLAGSGVGSYKNGGPSQAMFNSPYDVVVTLGNVVFVADAGNRSIRKIDANGHVTHVAGSTQHGYKDGKGSAARFYDPRGIDADNNGYLYVADYYNSRIRRVAPDGTVDTIAGAGNGMFDGPAKNAKFARPVDVTIDAAGRLWVADTGNHRIRRFAIGGSVTTVAGTGSYGHVNGSGITARFNSPHGVAASPDGTVYVADWGNYAIRKVFDGDRACSIGGACFADGIPNPANACQACVGLASSSKWSALPKDTPCDDGKPCTSKEACDAKGACKGKAAICDDGDKCTIDVCEAGTGQCIFTKKLSADCYCTQTKHCDDGNVCTNDACSGGKCVKTFNNNPCKAEEACSAGDTCSFGQCVALHSTVAGWFCGNGYSSKPVDGSCKTTRMNYPYLFAQSADGTVYVAGNSEHRVRRIKDGVMQTIAGQATSAGYLDGIGSVARFRTPLGIGLDAKDSVYISDHNNSTIRKISKTGLVSTLSGNGNQGYVNGPKNLARFRRPRAIHVTPAGEVIVADDGNNRIRHVAVDGTASTIAGSGGSGYKDGPAGSATFRYMRDLTVDSQGNIWLSQHSPSRIRRISTAGQVTTILGQGGDGFADGPAKSAKMSNPTGIRLDRAGRLYFADSSNNRIRKLENGVVSTLVGQSGAGYAHGPGGLARFNHPTGLLLRENGSLLIMDHYNHRIRTVWDSKDNCLIDKTCWKAGFGPANDACKTCAPAVNAKAFTARKAGALCDDGKACTSSACDAKSACVGKKLDCDDGNPCTLDSCKSWGLCHHVLTNTCDDGDPCTLGETCVSGKCKPELDRWVDWYCGSGYASKPVDGPCKGSKFSYPYRIRTTADGKVWVFGNGHRVRQLDNGAIKTFAGTGTAGLKTGYTNQAQFNNPNDIAVLKNGDYIVVDQNNDRLRRIDGNDYVSVYAGSKRGYKNGPLAAAEFNRPWSMVGAKGDILFVGDFYNRAIRRVAAGAVTTFTGGHGSGSKDGPANTAQFRSINDMAMDGHGNIWVASRDDSRIRRVSPDGTVKTIAGGAYGFLDATGTAAKFAYPQGVAVDRAGRVYVADSNNHRIRLIAPNGAVTTLAGIGTGGYAHGAGSSARFNNPIDIMLDAFGTMIVVDQYNHRLRRVRHSIGRCNIGSKCWSPGLPNPSNTCQVCDAAKSKTSWTAAADAAACDDGTPCTVTDKCASGQCKGTAKKCGNVCEAGTGKCL